MKDEQLLAEVEDIMRTMPAIESMHLDINENFSWLGRLAAFIELWNPSKAISAGKAIRDAQHMIPQVQSFGLKTIQILLHEARNSLRMKTIGPLNTAIGSGLVFHYFDEVRKIIELARRDLLFVDPYIDAEFVSRYLPHVASGVLVRLLAGKKLATLLPAVETFVKQFGVTVQVRSAANLHDRYVIVDQQACYQSGASFKDGAKSAPTTLSQIIDAFGPVSQTYENLWKTAKVEI